MKGAFNDVTLALARGAEAQDVIDRVDAILGSYGGTGGYARKDQFSNRFLSEELKQLQTTATLFPAIFLGVAAFLLNVVVSRLIALQREQIAILKAFGYSHVAIVWHYVKLVLQAGLGISAVERDTGLSKDTLRVWERRYGFPRPVRDALGERTYPVEQVDRLRLIRRLMDAGHRPGKVVGLPVDGSYEPPPGKTVKSEITADLSVIVELMSQVDKELPLDRMEATLKRDASLSFKLLRYLNRSTQFSKAKR